MSPSIQTGQIRTVRTETLRAHSAILTILFVASACVAQPTQVSYQGELRKDGRYFDGVAQMKFAIVDGGTTLWSNDASSTNGSEPTAAASLNVFRGIFTTQLGQSPMQPLNAVALNGAVAPALRVWVRTDAGPGAFEQLSPDQPVSSSAFALLSAAPWAMNGPNIYNTNSGSVGIGTASPTEKLTVTGGRIYPSGVGINTGIQFSHLHLFEDNDLTLKLTSAGAYNLALLPEGSVGIGTTNFNYSSKLHVSDGLAVSELFGNGRTAVFLDGDYNDTGRAAIGSTSEIVDRGPLSFVTADGERMTIDVNGNTGIGTTAPATALHIQRPGMDDNVQIQLQNGAADWRAGIQGEIGDRFAISANGSNDNPFVIDRGDGSGIQNDALVIQSGGEVRMKQVAIGTTAPVRPLRVVGQSGGIELAGTVQSEILWADPSGNSSWVLTRRDDVGGANNDLKLVRYTPAFAGITMQISNSTGYVGIGTSSPTAELHVNGTTRTNCLSISGGCDIAEPFEVSNDSGTITDCPAADRTKSNIYSPRNLIEPGMLVSIDRNNPGKIRLSAEAYDTTVVGVVSGAGGVNTGMTLSQQGTLDAGIPVALTGRVYCWCDASNGAIQPGDLLTTSATPGHAMKVGDKGRAGGAMIGKALSGLDNGQGLVLIVVSLQ